MGRGWAAAPLCDNCKPNHPNACTCEDRVWDPDCPTHNHDPYDIPF